ncbi:MAG: hypothetical protein PHQ09_02870 [Actinomycetota bacterium]|nr:hypothetical protein [Actinomycetota bacterium]
MIKTNGRYTIQKKIQELESHMPELEKEISSRSFPLVLALAIIVVLNLTEIGYFIYSNYFFNDFVITLGSAILIGYTLYSMIKFLPGIKKFVSKPLKYFKEINHGFDNTLNFIMVALEIVFCAYIMIKIFIEYILLG